MCTALGARRTGLPFKSALSVPACSVGSGRGVDVEADADVDAAVRASTNGAPRDVVGASREWRRLSMSVAEECVETGWEV
jgi:hypothetical protein